MLGDTAEWGRVEAANKLCVSARIAREALVAGVAQDRVTMVEEDGPKGATTKRTVERSIDVAALRLAGEHVDPERFGKLAGAKNADKPAIQLAVVFTDARRVDVSANE
jgi:hypothetical protein